MDLNEIISNTELTAETLSPEQKTFLTEKAAELSDDDAKRFGIDNTPKVPDPVARPGLEPEKPPKEGGEAGDDDEEIDPEDQKKIEKQVQKTLTPIQKQLAEQRDIAEADNFIRTNADKYPTAGKFRDAMLRYMKAYPNVPVDGVFKIVAGDELMRMGAQREREAARKANGTRVHSSQARPQGGAKKDWSTATPEEIAAKRAEVFGRPV